MTSRSYIMISGEALCVLCAFVCACRIHSGARRGISNVAWLLEDAQLVDEECMPNIPIAPLVHAARAGGIYAHTTRATKRIK